MKTKLLASLALTLAFMVGEVRAAQVTSYPVLPGGLQSGDILYAIRNNTDYQTPWSTITGGSGITALTGDILASGTGSVVATLPTINSNVGTCNNPTVNAKGQVVACATQSYLTANQPITFSGAITGFGTTSIVTTLGTSSVSNANLANSILTIGSTPIALGSTVSSLSGVSVNGVMLGTSGSASAFLNQQGNYVAIGTSAGGSVASISGSTGNGATVSVGSSTTTPVISVAPTVGGSFASLLNNLGAFASTTSAQLASVISDETGSGFVMFSNSPTTTGTLTGAAANFSGAVTGASFSGAHTGTINGVTISSSGSATSYLNQQGAYVSIGSSTGSGTVSIGSTGQVPYYASNGTTVAPLSLGPTLSINSATLNVSNLINANTGTTASIGTSSLGYTITQNSASASTYTLPADTSAGFGATGFNFINLGTGTTTFNTSGTMYGPTGITTSLPLPQGYSASFIGDGTNWNVAVSAPSGSGSSVIFPTVNSIVLSAGTSANPTGLIGTSSGQVPIWNGTVWVAGSPSSTASTTVGTSASATSPQLAGDSTSGLSSIGTSSFGAYMGGKVVEQWNYAASAVNGLSVTPGATGVAPTITSLGSDANGAGLGVTIQGRAPTATGAAGGVNIYGSSATGASTPGAINITPGAAGNGSVAGAALNLNGGGGGGAGGAVNITGGNGAGSGTGTGGGVNIKGGGSSYSSNTMGAVLMQGGDATVSGNIGGAIVLRGGNGNGSGNGASASLAGGSGGTTGIGGTVTISGGAGGTTSGNAGNIILSPGVAVSGTAGAVGVGTASPGTALDVTGSVRSTLIYECTEGAAITSAATIAPTACIHHVTGTSTINTITAPPGMDGTHGGCITLIADGAFTTSATGNIQSAMTATSGTPYQACYSSSVSKWFIK